MDTPVPSQRSVEIPPLGSEQQRIVRLSLTVLAVLGSGSMLGVAFSLYLVNHYPLLLIGLSPLGRHLFLVAPIVHPVAFVGVAVGRRMSGTFRRTTSSN